MDSSQSDQLKQRLLRLSSGYKERAEHCGRVATSTMTNGADASKYALRAALFQGFAEELDDVIASGFPSSEAS